MLSNTSDPWPHSYYDVIEYHKAQYDTAIASGDYQPFLQPWGLLGSLLVILYLLIPHQNRPWLRKCRYLVFACMTVFATYTIKYTKAKGFATGIVVGILSAWGVVWTAAILICNDAQTDFMRIERTEGFFGSGVDREKVKDPADALAEPKDTKGEDSIRDDLVNGSSGPRDRHGEVAWQPYPITPFIERLDWVLDLYCNFRGMGWNWRIPVLPPPPKPIESQLRRNACPPGLKHSYRTYPGQAKQYTSRKELLRNNIWKPIIGYLVVDAIKTCMTHDPYFWGYVDQPPPTYFPSLLTNSPVLTHIYRLLFSMLALSFAMRGMFSLGPLVFSVMLPSSLLGVRGEPWMYPDAWGPYSVVLEKGLTGWWSNWWHQTFRFGFQEPSRKLVEVLGLDRRSTTAKTLQLFIVFFISGLVHASGSATCVGDTEPLRGPMAFFLLQGIGVFAEQGLSQAARAAGIGQKMPSWLMKSWKFIYVHVWFYFTAHLLCDDFAKGRVWLLEPSPVSLFRGLGLGVDPREGWGGYWGCWDIIWWHSGDSWWTSGIAS